MGPGAYRQVPNKYMLAHKEVVFHGSRKGKVFYTYNIPCAAAPSLRKLLQLRLTSKY